MGGARQRALRVASLANGDTPAHYWAHARVLLSAPIADVWAALQWQPGPLGRLYPFHVRWRAQATRVAAAAIAQVNVRGWEYEGHEAIALMRQSVVVTPAVGGGTKLEVVRHINAPDETEASAADWIRLYFRALDAQVKGTRETLIPTTWCFP